MSVSESKTFSCEQFIWGKMIRDGKDISGYAIVGKSPGLSDEFCGNILSKARLGASPAILEGRRGYAFFNLSSERTVFSCTHRSHYPEKNGRHFLQTHYLVMDWNELEAVQVDFIFLASLIRDIPIFDGETQLPRLTSPYRKDFRDRATVVKRIIQRYPLELIMKTLRAASGPYPVAMFDSTSDENELLELFQVLSLLLHPEARQNFTFATFIPALEETPFKIKINPAGVLKMPHIVIRIEDSAVVPASMFDNLPDHNSEWVNEILKEYLASRYS